LIAMTSLPKPHPPATNVATADAAVCVAANAHAAAFAFAIAFVPFRLDLIAMTNPPKPHLPADADAVDAAFIFWPALFLSGGDDQSPELARLRGEAEALQAAATARGC
jgi:hypothetical protein